MICVCCQNPGLVRQQADEGVAATLLLGIKLLLHRGAARHAAQQEAVAAVAGGGLKGQAQLSGTSGSVVGSSSGSSSVCGGEGLRGWPSRGARHAAQQEAAARGEGGDSRLAQQQ